MEKEYCRQIAALQNIHWWYEGRRRIISDVIVRLKLPAGAEILEAGCGSGANLGVLQKFGKVSGFEPDDFAAKYASEVSGCRILNGYLPDQIPFSTEFDLVCAFDVIEHIDDEAGALDALFCKTKAGGYALLTVPAHQWLWSSHDDMNHHKRRYNLLQFQRAIEKAGYHVKKISYYNMWLFPLAIVARYIKKIFRMEDKSDVSMPSMAVNKALARIFSSEKYFLRYLSFPFGLSIIALCGKLDD